jgi:hypothetical protein
MFPTADDAMPYFSRYPTEGIHPYLDAVLGLAWSNDCDSNPGGSVPTGSAGQVKGDDPDYKGYLGPPG